MMLNTNDNSVNQGLQTELTVNRLFPRSKNTSKKRRILPLIVLGALLVYLLFSSVIITKFTSLSNNFVSNPDNYNHLLSEFIGSSSVSGGKGRGTDGYQNKSTTVVRNQPDTIVSIPKEGKNATKEVKNSNDEGQKQIQNGNSRREKPLPQVKKSVNEPTPILKAYIEDTNQAEWDVLPLPTRRTKSTDLKIKEYPGVSSCTKLTEQWPIDEEVAPTNSDPFLPWIHDVFPTADGKFIQFVAQNKRRCQSGIRQTDIKKFMQPNVALFQHVPVKRIQKQTDDEEQRYRLSTHEEADKDGIETRFICRFKPSMEETLSVFNFNYDYNTFRKAYLSTFTKEGFDVHIVWNSQHLFRCPVPESLQETIRSGSSVLNDYATQFVDLIPIRTPPRYIFPKDFLPPRYGHENKWNATENFGSNHILPRVEDSGRLENIPICKPSLMTYPDTPTNGDSSLEEENSRKMEKMAVEKEKKHKLIMCTWTSAGFHTRGDRTFVTDGPRRLLEWIQFNKLIGVDHLYIYDNSGGVSGKESLKPVTDLFPGFVTRINWPCKVCNNRPGNGDNKGERSSQYAAESSCRLRFGSHSDWLGAFDTDEYVIPLGIHDNIRTLLDDMDKEDTRIVSFASKRSRPRLRYLDSSTVEGHPLCLDPSLPKNTTFLEAYNCNYERPPRKNLMPAEKQIYKTDYVLLHFVHYSAITTESAMSEEEAKAAKIPYRRNHRDRHTRFVDETKEATMLHAKSITIEETKRWKTMLQNKGQVFPKIGVEFPLDKGLDDGKVPVEVNGVSYFANCFPVERVDSYWIPKLKENLIITEVR